MLDSLTGFRAFKPFKHRNYRLFFTGQLVSLTGTWMQATAESWLVYRLTGSSTLLGVAAFCTQAPVLLFGTIGGAVADRGNRHRIIVVTQSISMVLPLTLAYLTFSGRVQVWHILVLASCLGIVNAFDVPARQSFLIEIVGRNDLGNAIALNSAMYNGARVMGPAVAGILIGLIGEAWCFLFNGVSYIGVITGLLLMRIAPVARVAPTQSAIAAALEGFRFVFRTAPVRALILLIGIVSFSSMPYAVLMPIFAQSILHAGPSGLGLLMGSTGLGAMCGALTVASRSGVRGLGRWVAISSSTFSVALILFSLSRYFWLSSALLVVVGMSMMIQMAASNTLVQSMVPDAIRGRVMAVYAMMFLGMAPFGALWAGTLAERIGAPLTVAIGGVVCLIGATVFAFLLPAIRAEGRRLIGVQEQLLGAEPPMGMG